MPARHRRPRVRPRAFAFRHPAVAASVPRAIHGQTVTRKMHRETPPVTSIRAAQGEATPVGELAAVEATPIAHYTHGFAVHTGSSNQ